MIVNIKNHSTIIAGFVVAVVVHNVQAQDADSLKYQVGIEGGTTGLGGHADWRFTDHLGIRAGFNYFQYSRTGEIEGANYRGDIRLNSAPLVLDVYPWSTRSFRIGLGIAFNQNRFGGTASPAENTSVDIGDQTYTLGPGDRVDLRIKQLPINPYLSIGGNLIYFDRAHRWALAGELGVMYTGKPKIDLMTNSALIAAQDLEIERAELQKYADRVQFWPVIKMGVNFRF